MSALVAAPGRKTRARTEQGETRPAVLRPLATPSRRMARLPFLIVLIVAFGVGMAGLLLLNTTLQNQEFEARRLTRQASELTYVQDDLESQLQTVSSPGSLAQKAYDLRMRPNVHAAFLVLPDGTVKGQAKTTKGTEMRYLVPGAGEQLTAARAAEEQAAKEAAARAKAQRTAQQQQTQQQNQQQNPASASPAPSAGAAAGTQPTAR